MPVQNIRAPKMISNPGTEYSAATRTWQGIPGIEADPNGRFWATWYTGGKCEELNNHVVVVESRDNGESWSDPVLVVLPGSEQDRCFDPCLWRDPGGTLRLFWAICQDAHYDGRAGVWMSCLCNEGGEEQWSEPIRISDGIMMNKPTVTKNGEWMLPVAVWPSENSPEELKEQPSAKAVVSSDQGATWLFRGGVTMPERSYDEHMFVEKEDGRLWMLARTNYGIGESTSEDGGVTWSEGKASGLRGPSSRFFIRRLKSGRLLLVTHDQEAAAEFPKKPQANGGNRSHLTAWLSEDDGTTWLGGLLLDERFFVSYPDGIELSDGSIAVVYDRERGDFPANVKEEAVEILQKHDRAIHYARFREEDVLAGKVTSSLCKLKQVINAIGPRPAPICLATAQE